MTESIHPDTTLGPVHLTVSNLDRLLDWYQRVFGFQVHRREGETAHLGAGQQDLLVLTEQPGAGRYRGTTGLYHFAVLLPRRRELARAIGRLLSVRYPNYPTDHVMTQTTYLDDPEGNGIEIYTDTPEEGTFRFADGEFEARDARGNLRSGRDPLDLKALFKQLDSSDWLDEPLPAETKIGHIHLHVADINAAVQFYHDLLGFDVMGVSQSMGAAFVSAGGYHHHIGLNTWVGQGAPPPPPGALGLRHFTVVLPDKTELERVAARVQQTGIAAEQTESGIVVRDPSKNGVLLTLDNKENHPC